MIQTAQIHSEKQYLVLSDQVSDKISQAFVATSASHGLDSLLANHLFQKISPFHYNNRIRISFRISDDYKSDFVLLKGLIEFNRPKDLVFAYDREQRSITTDIREDQPDQLRLFLSSILAWLNQEKKFRHALRIALEFESRYKFERDSVYEILRNTTVAAYASVAISHSDR